MVSSAGFKYDDHDDNEEDYECLTDNKDNTGVSVMNMYPRFSNTIDNVHDNDNEKLYGLQIVGGEARKCWKTLEIEKKTFYYNYHDGDDDHDDEKLYGLQIVGGEEMLKNFTAPPQRLALQGNICQKINAIIIIIIIITGVTCDLCLLLKFRGCYMWHVLLNIGMVDMQTPGQTPEQTLDETDRCHMAQELLQRGVLLAERQQ